MRGAATLTEQFCDHLAGRGKHAADFRRSFPARFRESGRPAAAAAHDRGELLDDLPGRYLFDEVGRDADDDRNLAVAGSREDDNAALDAIAMLVDERAQAVLVETRDLAGHELHASDVDDVVCRARAATTAKSGLHLRLLQLAREAQMKAALGGG